VVARRLHEALRKLGYDCTLFVASVRTGFTDAVREFRQSSTWGSRVRRRLRRWQFSVVMRPYRRTRWRENGQLYPFTLVRSLCGRELLGQLPVSDVLNVHSVGAFMDLVPFLAEIPRRVPVVLTLHDMLFFTGGCHHSYGCERWQGGCGACPQLGSTRLRDLATREWEVKRAAFRRAPSGRVQLVVPARWLAEAVGRSAVLQHLPVSVIPHGVDPEVFRPWPRAVARAALGVPHDARVLLFAVAGNLGFPGKGLSTVSAVVARLRARRGLMVVTWGGRGSVLSVAARHLGWIEDEHIRALVYSAGDVLLMPSRQETVGLTALEAQACGVPVVAFHACGLAEIVRHGRTGLIVNDGDVDAFRQAVEHLLDDDQLRVTMGTAGRELIFGEYTLELQARRYAQLYEAVVESANKQRCEGSRLTASRRRGR
jgi:glycosyltransferase involved in cell wall biosynthesis